MKNYYISFLLCLAQPLMAQMPDFNYAFSYGGYSLGSEIAVYPNGEYISAGRYLNTIDLDPSSGVSQHISAGSSDIYLVKHEPDGAFLWSKSIGEPSFNSLTDIVLDVNNDLLLAGTFQNELTIDNLTVTANANDASFLASIDSSGTAQWAFALQSTVRINIWDIEIAHNGDILIIGQFNGTTDFDPSASETFQLTAPENGYSEGNIYIARYTTQGSFVGAWQMEGEDYKAIQTLIKIPTGGYYMAGTFGGDLDVNPDPNETEIITSQHENTFILKLDDNLNLTWVRQFNPIGNDDIPSVEAQSMIASPQGDVYLSGEFKSTIDFDPNPATEFLVEGISTDSNFSGTGYILKLDADGNLQWFRNIENSQQRTSKLTLDNQTNLIVTGSIYGDDMDINTDPTGTQLISSGPNLYTDGVSYIISLQPDGDFNWGGSMGASDLITRIDDINYHPDGSILMTGTFDDTADLDPTNGVFELTAVDFSFDAYIVKMQGAPLSVQDFLIKDSFTIHPNPANNEINLGWSESLQLESIEIIDVQGRSVMHLPATPFLTIEALQKGIYFCVAHTQKGAISKKFIKE